MKRIFHICSAIRRKGLGSTLVAGFRHIKGLVQDHQIRQWYRRAHAANKQFDRLFCVDTSTAIDVVELDVEAPRKADSNRFQSIYEHLFEEAFKNVRIDYSQYYFVDFGAGKGKALMLASRYPFKKVIGVEFSAKLCRACEANLAKFRCPRQKTRTFEVLCIDARQYQPPPDPTVFFLFNPFRGALMHSVVDGLATSLREHPRPAWIVYCNPDCAEYFDAIEIFESVATGRRYRVWRTHAT